MRTVRLPLLAAVASASLVALSLGCGGGQTTTNDPSGAQTATSGAEPKAAEGTGDPSEPGSATGGTTTTTAIPEGGELQGAKLGSSSRQEIETKGESGPKGGGPSTEPGRTRQDIQAIIGAHRDDARACYDKGLEKHPGIEGDLTVKWTINPDGTVSDVAVDPSKSQILEPSVGDCVVGVIKKLTFAPSQKGFETRANYPFNFHPRKASPKPAGGAK
jgi:outer membrane biosynthesis protein TonB